MDFYPRYGKRIFDGVLISAAAVLILAALIVITLAYVLTGNWPAIFRQSRIGRNEKIFTMYKFRTLKGTDQLPLSHRTFTLGKILRLTNLDELPQVWNVLKGDMTLVGPRPLPTAYLNLIPVESRKRHALRPGITGLVQVSGKNSAAWKQKFEWDLHYINQVSFATDILIILKTIALLLIPKRDTSLSENKPE